jgi:CheY-like chemotaxis protein
LRDCQVVRAPGGSVAWSFIEVINYSLLLFDHALADMTGAELAEATRALPHRERTQIFLIPVNGHEASVAETITHLLQSS